MTEMWVLIKDYVLKEIGHMAPEEKTCYYSGPNGNLLTAQEVRKYLESVNSTSKEIVSQKITKAFNALAEEEKELRSK